MWEGARRLRTALIADDDPAARAIARTALEEGFLVIEARNGREALTAVARLARPPDIAVIELAMPVMSGVEALALLKDASPDIPVIALAGAGPAQADLLEAAARLGAEARLPKSRVARDLRAAAELLARPLPAGGRA